MSDYSYSTHSFAGISIDSFVTSDNRLWTTLTPFAEAAGGSRRNIMDWVERKGQLETLSVKVGKRRNVNAKAYLISDVADYLDYRIQLGDKKALAIYSATFRADLERSVKEAHGESVTAAQHEETRATIREALIKKVMSGYQAGTWLEDKVCQEAGLTKVESDIASKLAYIADKELKIAQNPKAKRNIEAWQQGIKDHQKEIQVLRQSC